MKPKLSEKACATIANEYSRLRSQDITESDVARTQPVTARSLETLIRLSTAHAKARLATVVTEQDAQAAIELVQFAYFKKVLEKEKKKRRRDDEVSDDNEDITDLTTEENPTRKSKRSRKEASQDVHDDDSDIELPTPEIDAGDLTRRETRKSLSVSTASTAQTQPTNGDSEATVEFISEDRFKIFKTNLQKAFRETREQSLSLERVIEFVNKGIENDQFSKGEIDSAIERMTDDNHIMLADGFIILI